MRTRPNFGVIGQAQYKTNTSTGTVLSTSDYVNNKVIAATGTPAQGVDAVNGDGGTITYSGNYKIHTYTGSGTFTPSFTGNVELMMIGGGGGAGGLITPSVSIHGGSSGGMIYYGVDQWPFKTASSITLTAGTNYTITIGAGGSWTTGNIRLTIGGSTTLVGGALNLTAYGGICGRRNSQASGAGAGGYFNPYTSTDLNNTNGNPAPGQGYPGGYDYGSDTYPDKIGAGGGGVGQPGGYGGGQEYGVYTTLGYQIHATGQGGNGFITSISGTVSYYGGGGAAASRQAASGTYYGPMGGMGGGGRGSGIVSSVYYTGDSGSPNTGGGGGGGSSSTIGGNGGSGIVIIRYSNL